MFTGRIHRCPGGTVALVTALGLALVAGASSTHLTRPRPESHAAVTSAADVRKIAETTATSPPPVDTTFYQQCLQLGETTNRPNIVFTAYAAGYANDARQSASVPLGSPEPAFLNGMYSTYSITNPRPVINGVAHLVACSFAQVNLDDQGIRELPPFTATFSAFGSVPVSVTAQLTQDGPDPLNAVLYDDEGPFEASNASLPWSAVATGRMAMQVTSVTVNGQRLDVGPSCRTDGDLTTPGNPVAPGELMLSGGSNPGDPVPWYGAVAQGGALAGTATIPPFTGCQTASGENLDALLTASASGPGNYVQLSQGAPCLNLGCRPGNLPAGPPPLLTVSHGGQFSAQDPLTIFNSTFGTNPRLSFGITCDSRIDGLFPDISGPLRGALASVSWTQITNCQGSDGSTWQVVPETTGLFGGVLYCDAESPPALLNTCPAGTLKATVSDVSLRLTETGPSAPPACAGIEMSGFLVVFYATGELQLPRTQNLDLVPSSSACPRLPDGGYGMEGTYAFQGAQPVVTSILP